MKYLFMLALKNIRRAKTRTILTFLIISFGVVVYLVMEGMLEGFDRASFQNYIEFETGHFKIRKPGFDMDHPYDMDNILTDTDTIRDRLSSLDFVSGFTPRLNFLAELDNGMDSIPVIAVGIDPETDGEVFSLSRYIVKGKLERGGCLIGRTLAEDMDVGIGNVVYITFRDKEGMFTSVELLVTGLVMTGDPKTNNLTVFINIHEAREYIGTSGATEFTVTVPEYTRTEKYEPILESKLTGYTIQSWKELSTDFAALMELKRQGGLYFLFFIVIIALVGIINTLLMSVYEKKQEIGTLMALGMEHRDVRNMFIFEGLIIGLAGCILGLIAGTLINLYFIYHGIDYTALMGGETMGFNIMGHVKSAWVFAAYVQALVIVVIASVLSSYYPAKKVMQMEPAECLRTVQ